MTPRRLNDIDLVPGATIPVVIDGRETEAMVITADETGFGVLLDTFQTVKMPYPSPENTRDVVTGIRQAAMF